MLDPTRFRIGAGVQLDLTLQDPHSTSGFEGGKKEAKDSLSLLRERLSDLQRRLWGESKRGLLVVLQAMDTGGKDGTIRHVFTGVNPQGVHVRSFSAPTEWEAGHDFLWRVHAHAPEKGAITIFNRSHYEDVLAARVRRLVPETQWKRRYRHIVDFERMLHDEGTTVVKLFLNISKDEQKARLQSRLDEPDKRWKFSRGDLADRQLWDDYMRAYEDAISRTSTDYAPWFVVPANRKWFRNLVVSSILVNTLEALDPRYPEPEGGIEGLVVR